MSLEDFLGQCRAAEDALAQPCAPSAKEQAVARLETLAQSLQSAAFGPDDSQKAVEALLRLRVKGSTAARLDRVKGNLARVLERAKSKDGGDAKPRLDVTF